ncbi:MAG: endonuclease/exonuclease/phosphatase family protein [Planctomycetes bacterium]|nr:endonuclease/exonuclease/phosphatase family protein [Planctomycetota bacterium]
MNFTLITHNAYWFQGMPFEGTAPGAPRAEIAAGLAKLYRKYGANALCLQEVQSNDAYAEIAVALGLEGQYRPGRTYAQYGGAVLWGQGEAAANDGAAAAPVERFWVKARLVLASGEWLALANVHLPSGRQSSKDEAAQSRLAELRGMLGAGPRPDVVAGDFNEPPGGGVQRLMEAEGYADLAVHFGHGETDTHTRKHARRIDYVWVREPLLKRARSYHVPEPAELALGGGRYLSDHLPVVASFE